MLDRRKFGGQKIAWSSRLGVEPEASYLTSEKNEHSDKYRIKMAGRCTE
jgi:hypothetical protein